MKRIVLLQDQKDDGLQKKMKKGIHYLDFLLAFYFLVKKIKSEK